MARARIAGKSKAVTQAADVPIDRLTGATMVSVGGEVVHVGKLSLKQWLALPRFAAKMFDALPKDDVAELKERMAGLDESSKLDDMFSWLAPMLTEENVVGLYGIVTDLDETHLRDTFDMAEFIDVLSALVEHNDAKRIVSAFRNAAKHWSPRSDAS